MTLSKREALFVREFLIDLNAAAAARRAGYSAKSARSQASRMLTKRNIQQEVAKAHSERLERLDLSADALLQELGRVGYTDVDGVTRIRDFAKVAALRALLRYRERVPEPPRGDEVNDRPPWNYTILTRAELETLLPIVEKLDAHADEIEKQRRLAKEKAS
jgi:hypothetical protein